MLSASEYTGLKEILNDIDREELFSVLDTVTKRMFTTSLRNEAIEKILSCTEKPSDLLRRQKITKKVLFNYLVKKGTMVLADWEKSKLVNKCLELWESIELSEDVCDFEEVHNEVQPKKDFKEADVTLMGVEFCRWFFRILNTLEGFGPVHFWPSCNLSAQLLMPSGHTEASVSGANDVATFLANLIMLDKFYFHANDSKESILLEVEEHGLVKIIIHGVLHQYSSCVGLFDSAFGLVKHPNSPDTYKIQVVKVKMIVNNASTGALSVNNCPSICQTA